MVVRVRERSGQIPITGAVVSARWGSELWIVGQTDENGVLVAHVRDGTTVLARHESFAPTWCSVQDASRAGEILLDMDSASRLRGRVIEHGSGLPVPAVGVFAVAAGESLSQQDWDSPVGGEGRILESVTGEDGTFEIPGIRPGSGYLVHASGRWLLSESSLIEDTGQELELIVRPLHGAVLRIRETAGDCPQTNPRFTGWGPTVSLVGGHPVPSALPSLARLGLVDLPLCSRRDDRLILAVDSSGLPTGGRVTANVSVDVPGYSPHRFEIDLPALADGNGLAEYSASIGDPITEHGDAVFTFSRATEHSTLIGRVARLVFRPVESGRLPKNCYLSLDELPAGDLVVEQVPAGTYHIDLEAENGFWTGHAATEAGLQATDRISILPGALTEISVELEGTGAVEFVLADSRGQAYAGPLSLGLKRMAVDGSPLGDDRVTMSGAPYVIDLLPVGQYRVEVDGRIGPRAADLHEFAVVPMSRALVPIEIELKSN